MSVDYLITSARLDGIPSVRAGLRELESGISSTESKFDGLKGLLAGGLALGGLNVVSNNLVQTGNEAANIQKKLEAMAAVRGQSGALDGLNDAFTALSNQTGIDDDNFADAGAHLLSFGLSAQQVAAILPGITGQADTMGESLDSVADSFGRAFASGEAGALTRSGVVLSKMDKDAIDAAKGISEAAGQQELFNRVLASYQHFAVAAGAGTTDAARAQGVYATQIGNTMEILGAGASDARAAWQAMLTPTIEALNANHEGLLQNIGATIEYGTQIGNVAAPIGALIKAGLEFKNFLNLNSLALIAQEGAETGATAATTAHAAANVVAAAAQAAETNQERAKLPVLIEEAAGHEAAAAAALEHAAANEALGVSGGAGGAGGVSGAAGLLANPLVRAGGAVALGVGAGIAGYNATREEGMPSAGDIGAYYKNRFLGNNANDSALLALGGDPSAKGNDAEKKSAELFAKLQANSPQARSAAFLADHPPMSGAQPGGDSGQISNAQHDVQTSIQQGATDQAGNTVFKITHEHTITVKGGPGDKLARDLSFRNSTPRTGRRL